MSKRNTRLIERTDGRRKGYVPHGRLIRDLIDPNVREQLDLIRLGDEGSVTVATALVVLFAMCISLYIVLT